MRPASVRTGLRRLLTAGCWVAVPLCLLYACAVWFVVMGFDGNAKLPSDCAIVFGTAVRPVVQDGRIIYTAAGPGILRRVAAAAELYRTGQVKTIYLTGGKGQGMKESEASVMRRMAVVNGVAQGDMRVEEASRSTWENIHNTLPLMRGCRSIVAVSDRYHLARIRVIAEQAGGPMTTYPAAAAPDWRFESLSVLREAAGIMLIALQGLLT